MPATSVYDRERLARLLRYQYNVISRSQVLECGMTPRTLEYRLRRGGPWQRLLPGVYLAVNGMPTRNQLDMAALLYAGPASVITGPYALRRWNVNCALPGVIDLLIPADDQRKSTGFVRIQRTTRMPDKTYESGPIRFALTHRAVADAARAMQRIGDVRAVVCEAIQRAGCPLPLLVRELNEGPSAGSRAYRIALAEISDGVRSTAEADLHELIEKSDLEKPIYNASLCTADGVFIATVDAWWQQAGVAAEVDSVEYHFRQQQYKDTTKRRNRLEATYDIRVLTFQPSTIRSEPATVLGELRNAIAAGHRRPPLPILAVPTPA
jgi:hypothetical protein